MTREQALRQAILACTSDIDRRFLVRLLSLHFWQPMEGALLEGIRREFKHLYREAA